MTRIIRTGIAMASIATFALAGCGSDKKSSSTTAAPTTAAATATTAAATPTTGGGAATTVAGGSTTAAAGSTPAAGGDAISIKSFKFVVPDGLKAGGSVTITNADSAEHTFTDKGGKFSVDVKAGSSATLTLPAAGTYQLICNIHPSMSGTLTVA